MRVKSETRAKEAGGVAEEFGIPHFLVHIQHEFLVGGGVAGYEAEVAVVSRHYTVNVKFAGDESSVNVEEVTAFEALIEGAEDERVVVFLLLDDGFAQPGEDFAQMVYRFLDGFGVYLNQVDVFRVAGRRLQIEFVQRRATTEGEVFPSGTILPRPLPPA